MYCQDLIDLGLLLADRKDRYPECRAKANLKNRIAEIMKDLGLGDDVTRNVTFL